MICLDTTPLIWGVQGIADKSQTGMIARTKRYLRFLRSVNERIIVPTPVMIEYLSGFPAEEQAAQIAILESQFRLPGLDAPAAAIAGMLNAQKSVIQKVRRESDESRQALKIDVEIIAIAIAQKASCIITNNVKEFTALAQERIPIRPVPNAEEQRVLFET